MSHPAPPFYRSTKAGGSRHRVAVQKPANGRHQTNACVPPLVYTNGIGERTLFEIREVIVSAPTVDLD